MNDGDFEKTSYEEFYYFAEYKLVLDDDETLIVSSSDVIVYDKDDTDVTSTIVEDNSLTVIGTKLLAKFKAGSSSASPYHIIFRCTTSADNKYEAAGYMYIT